MSRLDEIKARADAATEGPWVRDMHSPDMSGRSGWYIRGPRKLGLRSMVLNSRMLPGDAEFIEHAREDVPWLVERIGELIGAICWDTTCLNCSSLLDSNYDQYMRAEIAEAEVERLTAERDALAAQVARLAKPGDSDARMDAYYYGFTRTGVGLVDDILSAVAKAGKSYHGTDMWNEELSEGGTCESRIQDAADAAAEQIRAALSDTDADTDADTTDTQPTDQEEQ
jgi:hypothetical protein